MNIKALIETIFAGSDAEQAYALITKYNIEGTLDRIVTFVEKTTPKDENLPRINAFVTLTLPEINSVVLTIDSQDDKENLQYLISKIAQTVLNNMVSQAQDPVKLLETIETSLQEACEYKGYDFNKLQEKFPVRAIYETIKSLETRSMPGPVRPYYLWRRPKSLLKELSGDLMTETVIKSKNEFQSLFGPHDGTITVRFNPTRVDYILALIDFLHTNKILIPQGRKGHFLPIQMYGVDFDLQKLILKQPNKMKFTLQKNSSKWADLQGKIQFKAKSIGLIES